MSTPFQPNDDVPILVELSVEPGMQDVSLTPEDLLEKSTEALNNAMGAIAQMARRTYGAIRTVPLSERPSAIEVEFNLKLTAEAGVVLAKSGLETTLNVKLTWARDKDKPDVKDGHAANP